MVAFCSYHQWGHKYNRFLLDIKQPEYGVEYSFKGIIWPVNLFLYGRVVF